MLTRVQLEYESFLSRLGQTLDISDSQYEAAVKHYTAVGELLASPRSPIVSFAPTVYPQGSFRLGTVVRPLTESDEYDVDLVCELKSLSRAQILPRALKAVVGNALQSDGTYASMLTEGDRCWTLDYSDSARFHMDILPAIPDIDRMDLLASVGTMIGAESILITDRKVQAWLRSNPNGFAEWFKERMKVQFKTKRLQLAEALSTSVDNIPAYRVKTPLQRSIQILKRHRDKFFQRKPESSPASIIITTLAAHAYDNEESILESLQSILPSMGSFVEERSGVTWIPNPANPDENFADCWKVERELESSFYGWLDAARQELLSFGENWGKRELTESLKARFGETVVNKVLPKETATAVAAAPHVVISNPAKPWRS